ncbi:MAG: tRNA pseudouridine(38-40) synthase TruA [Acetobacteraceae bacterium]|nr:tRNA pseudouridine(38-40) synthase TruA [Acetobacteraceae bacterium]
MTQFALEIEYDGTAFVGWQRQTTGISVQAVLETAAARLGGPAISITAGRTDSGVHAAAQVVGLHLDRDIDPAKLAEALNYHMRPHRVVILRAAVAPPGWSARFSAIGRAYRYRILNRKSPPALDAGKLWHVMRPLDLTAMRQGAAMLLGTHDFTSFRATACQARSPVRTLDRLDINRDGDIITFAVGARAFLHHQVRNIVGSLKLVGEGRWEVAQIAHAIAARDRRAAGPTAPAEGLCLVSVTYPVDPFGP